jgi:three-Cys-motif partner protein
MPKNGTVGWSKNTSVKHQHLQSFFKYHMNFAKGAIRKNLFDPIYLYFDLHAGDGYSPEYGKGSPLIAIKSANQSFEDESSWLPHFIERNTQTSIKLRTALPRTYRDGVFNDDYANYLNQAKTFSYGDKASLGLLFADPNGIKDFNSRAIADFVRIHKRVDVLIHLNPHTIKRVQGANAALGRDEPEQLIDILKAIANAKSRKDNWQKLWHIREPFSAHGQWTLLFCTLTDKFNLDDYQLAFPPDSKGRIEQARFNSLNSERGQEIFDLVTLTEKEFKLKRPKYQKHYHGQLALPGVLA